MQESPSTFRPWIGHYVHRSTNGSLCSRLIGAHLRCGASQGCQALTEAHFLRGKGMPVEMVTGQWA